MIREHGIKWYLEDPSRLMLMKPFTRGGEMLGHGYENVQIPNNTKLNTGICNLKLNPISQDTYLTEYWPDLHHIIMNKSIPHIKVCIDNNELPFGMLDMTQTASFQKLIHSAHVRSLTANPLDFTLGKSDASKGGIKLFESIKDEWMAHECDYYLGKAINTCKMVGNCALLFSFDTTQNKYSITSYSYEDGYQIVPNYDEYGTEIARSLVYTLEDAGTVIDMYDNTTHYHITQGADKGSWNIQDSVHGFSRIPLLTKRGKVAWEYAESTIEMWELMANIQDIALKRFGTFALVFTGDMDEDSFKRDSSTLIINLSSDTTGGKQDAKTLEFPEPQTMDKYLKTLEEKISLFSSTSFITPKDITTTNSGGNGIALAMSNDYALATQGALDWRRFVNDMVYLHQEGIGLENNGQAKFSKLHMSAKINPWSLETNNTKILNLQMEAKWLSMQTIIEKSPDAAPDEIERIIKERGSLVPLEGISDKDAEKAAKQARNNNSEIIDNKAKTGLS